MLALFRQRTCTVFCWDDDRVVGVRAHGGRDVPERFAADRAAGALPELLRQGWRELGARRGDLVLLGGHLGRACAVDADFPDLAGADLAAAVALDVSRHLPLPVGDTWWAWRRAGDRRVRIVAMPAAAAAEALDAATAIPGGIDRLVPPAIVVGPEADLDAAALALARDGLETPAAPAWPAPPAAVRTHHGRGLRAVAAVLLVWLLVVGGWGIARDVRTHWRLHRAHRIELRRKQEALANLRAAEADAREIRAIEQEMRGLLETRYSVLQVLDDVTRRLDDRVHAERFTFNADGTVALALRADTDALDLTAALKESPWFVEYADEKRRDPRTGAVQLPVRLQLKPLTPRDGALPPPPPGGPHD